MRGTDITVHEHGRRSWSRQSAQQVLRGCGQVGGKPRHYVVLESPKVVEVLAVRLVRSGDPEPDRCPLVHRVQGLEEPAEDGTLFRTQVGCRLAWDQPVPDPQWLVSDDHRLRHRQRKLRREPGQHPGLADKPGRNLGAPGLPLEPGPVDKVGAAVPASLDELYVGHLSVLRNLSHRSASDI